MVPTAAVVENATEAAPAETTTTPAPAETKAVISSIDKWYQVYQEPLIVEIDRSNCSRGAKQSCLCYGISEEFSGKPIDSKSINVCGRGFGLICSNVKYSGRLHVFLEGELASYSTAQHVEIPSFEVIGQAVGEKEHVGHLIYLRSSDDCAKITIQNVLETPRDIVPDAKDCPCNCKAKKRVKDEF
uniref:Uncharacterized protein n=1 Tax=Panagrolaimus sp. JU765 TaxID=591449 RepID=A0AC34QRE4_9BILA